jgi:hypothetical protein
MVQKTSPWLEGAYGWDFGEGGWNTGMDENLLKFSFMFDRNVDSVSATLPPAVNGQAHFNTTDNRFYFAVGTTYYSSACPKWMTFQLRGTGVSYQFNGVSVNEIDSISSLDSRLEAVELTISQLGSAAFESADSFASQAELDVVEAQSQTYTDTLRQDITDDGGFIGVISPLTGAVRRSLGTRAADWVSVLDFGAVPDGDAVTGAGTDNWAAFQAAIDTGKHVHIPGPAIYRIDGKELQFVRAGQIMSGDGMGSSYGPQSLRNHVHHTTLMFTGTGERYVKTRRQPREVVGDPNDAPLATAINVQNEGVQLVDFAVFCHVNYAADGSVANLGADWDVGVFNGSRAHMLVQRVRSIGYWRVASFYVDVTYAMTMPRFTNPRTGLAFPLGTYSGADKVTFVDCWGQGGRKGLFIAGAIETPSGDYYDGVSGTTLPNQGNRGGAGCSELNVTRCMLWGREHHSGYRAYDPRVDMNFDLESIDLMSAPLVIDGRRDGGTQNRLRRMLFTDCRFQTFEAVRVGLGRAYEVYFTNTNTEATSGAVFTSTGSPITQSDPSVNYGPMARATPSSEAVGSDRIFISGINAEPTAQHFQNKGGRYGMEGTVLGTDDQWNIRFQNQLQFPQGGFIVRNGTVLEVRSTPTSPNNGTDLSVIAGGVATLEGATSARVRVDGAAKLIATVTELQFGVTLRPVSDNVTDVGTSIRRVREIFAGNATINTSDERLKTPLRAIPDEVLDAWGAVDYGQWQWLDSVAEKGEAARLHVGPMAQAILRAFENRGLDATRYSLLCFDEWDAFEQEVGQEQIGEREVLGEDGEVVDVVPVYKPVYESVPAGSRWSIRPAECQFMEAAYQRREIARLRKALGAE